MKNGFTMAEMIITTCIVGIMSMILVPVLQTVFPNQEKMMFKKAYYATDKIVSELKHDDDLYPESDNPDSLKRPYFANTEKITYNGKEYSGDTKFCELFLTKLNLNGKGNGCSSGYSFEYHTPATKYTAETVDGVQWIIPVNAFSYGSYDSIYVDVNGDKGPNCIYSLATKYKCLKPDRFRMQIYYNGKLVPNDTKAIEYIKTFNISDEKDSTKD